MEDFLEDYEFADTGKTIQDSVSHLVGLIREDDDKYGLRLTNENVFEDDFIMVNLTLRWDKQRIPLTKIWDKIYDWIKWHQLPEVEYINVVLENYKKCYKDKRDKVEIYIEYRYPFFNEEKSKRETYYALHPNE